MSLNKLVKLDRRGRARLLLWATHLGSLLPLVWLFLDFWYYRLGADPVREAILRTGKVALVLLFLTLAITPLSIVLGWKALQPTRRWLGLYTFLYVTVHLGIFVGVDYALDLRLVVAGIVDNPYIVVGFTAFVLLIPLALTSTKGAMRRLGRNWKRLHWLIYPIGILAVWHYIWLTKDNTTPFQYAGMLAVLLALRLKPVRRAVAGWRQRVRNRRVRRRLDEGARATS